MKNVVLLQFEPHDRLLRINSSCSILISPVHKSMRHQNGQCPELTIFWGEPTSDFSGWLKDNSIASIYVQKIKLVINK